MTSGHGYQGGRSRCYNFWQDYLDCYYAADHPRQCTHRLSDYMECLHHRKEKARIDEIRKEWERKDKAGQISRENVEIPFAQTQGKTAVMRLGYIDQPNKNADSNK